MKLYNSKLEPVEIRFNVMEIIGDFRKQNTKSFLKLYIKNIIGDQICVFSGNVIEIKYTYDLRIIKIKSKNKIYYLTEQRPVLYGYREVEQIKKEFINKQKEV